MLHGKHNFHFAFHSGRGRARTRLAEGVCHLLPLPFAICCHLPLPVHRKWSKASFYCSFRNLGMPPLPSLALPPSPTGQLPICMTHLQSERERELCHWGLALSGHYVYAAYALAALPHMPHMPHSALTLTSGNCRPRLFIAAFNEQITSDSRRTHD